jgi:hypothetical protein
MSSTESTPASYQPTNSEATESRTEEHITNGPPLTYLNSRGILMLGIYLGLSSLLLLYLMTAFWPQLREEQGAPAAGADCADKVTLFAFCFPVPQDTRLHVIVLLGGAIGSMVHALKSFIAYTGNRRFIASWLWWYVLRAPLGAMLALIFYLAIRGGLLALGAQSKVAGLGVFAVAAIATLVGLFTEQATNKLKEVFDALFTTSRPDEMADKLTETPVPELTELGRTSLLVGTSDLSLTVRGRGFVPASQARLDGQARGTEFKSGTQLVVTLTPKDVETAGERKLTVFNPPPGGGESKPLTITVTS